MLEDSPFTQELVLAEETLNKLSAQDVQLIHKNNPLIGSLVEALRDKRVSNNEDKKILLKLFFQSLTIPTSHSYLSFKQISVLVKYELFDGENNILISRFLDILQKIWVELKNFRIEELKYLKQRKVASFSDIDEINQINSYFNDKIATEQSKKIDSEALEEIFSRVLFLQNNLPVKEWVSGNERATQASKNSLIFLQDLLDGQTIDSVTHDNYAQILQGYVEKVQELFKDTQPLISLLTIEFRNDISIDFKKILVGKFDEKNKQRFFDENGGLLKDLDKDIDYLKEHQMTLDQYIGFVSTFIMFLGKKIKNGTYTENNFVITSETGIRGGSMDDPFGQDHIGHMVISGNEISEIELYPVQTVGQSLKRGEALVIPGAWQFLLEQKILQSSSMRYSLSPRKVLPFLNNNRQSLSQIGFDMPVFTLPTNT